MKRAFALGLAVTALAVFVGVAFLLNPASVDVRLTPSKVVQLPLGMLLVGTLLAGAMSALVALALQQLTQRFSHWGQNRRAKQEARIAELNETGAALGWSGEIERSRAVLKKAWRKDPRNREAALALAASYTDTGENGAAKQTLEAAVAEAPNDPDLRYALGQALRRNGEIGAAIRMHETVRVQYPQSPRLLLALRALYGEAQQWKEAADVQELYLRQLPSSDDLSRQRDELRLLRYREAMGISDPSERLTALTLINDETPGFAPAIDSLGEALLAAGRSEEALRFWEKAAKRAPRLSLLQRMLELQTDRHGRKRVIDLLDRHAAALDSDGLQLLRARAALRDDDLERAQQALEAIAQQDRADVQRCWADLYNKRGNFERAWAALTAAADTPTR